jgi:receptor-type tyrosine-protein phosphatase zeta
MADVTWQPGPDNNDPISEYVVYYRDYPVSSASGGSPTRGPVDRKELQIGASLSSRDEEDEDGEEGTGGAEKDTTVSVSPWRMYEFFVVARNGLGESDLSASSTLTICQTPETAPARNPGRVCSRLQGSRQLVIVWEPLPEQEYNGPGFHYLVSYKLLDSPGLPETIRIDDPTQSEVVVHQREIFRKYEIRVQSANAVGISPVSVRAKIGYSSEGKPMDAPRNFRLDADSLNGTHAKFSWDPIDPAPERVQGFFRGYRIILWRTSKPNDRRTEDIILNDDFESCPDLLRSRRQVQQQSKGGARRSVGRESAAVPRPVVAATDKLWPYSRISAAVAVLNSANEGYQSDPPIEFETPEGVPGQVGSLKVVERGSNHLVVEWKPPVEPNGIINSYVLVCGVAPPNVGRPREIDITNPMQLTETIRDLESSTLYRIWVSGVTAAGQGDRIYIDGKTLEAAAPDKPLIGSLEVEDTSVLVKFSPSEVKPASNPGTIFYVEFVDEKNAERGPWNRTEPLIGAQSVNVSGLQPGTSYAFRVVAVNGIGETVRETRSDPHTVDIDAGGILTFPPPTEIQTDGPDFGAISDNEAIAHASSVWFIVLMILIALLLLILLIVCMIVRSRGEMYPVHEKETMWGRDPLAQDDKPFGEYTAGALPDHARSQGSLDSDEKPLDSGSETDSLGEYEDPEASKFNEDGSFIGLYSGQKSRPGGGGGGRTVSPSAVNTFV